MTTWPNATANNHVSRRPTALVESPFQSYPSFIATILEIEKPALDLPERERATLAANLLDSLPGILSDEDEGMAKRCDVMQRLRLILLGSFPCLSWIPRSRDGAVDAVL
jgi:hypothetical protein